MSRIAVMLFSLMLLSLSACNVAGWAMEGVVPTPLEEVAAAYTGLDGREVAVLVSADEATLYSFPAARQRVAVALSAAMAKSLTTTRVVNPRDVEAFQQAHPYWVTLSSTELARLLPVERILHVELLTYRTNEPGNANVWRGAISAHVRVVERERPEPPAFAQSLDAHFPPNTTIGLIDAQQDTVEQGMIATFTQMTLNLFQTHQVPIE